MVRQYFEDLGFQFIAKNKKVMGVEIDLIFYSSSTAKNMSSRAKDMSSRAKRRTYSPYYLMLEVKSLSSPDQISFRLKKSQIKRLLMAQNFFASQCGQDVQVIVVFVSPQGHFTGIDLSDML